MSEMIKRVAEAMTGCPIETMQPEDMVAWLTNARDAIEAMRQAPDVCYEHYRCDKMWRELNSTEVLNLWIDAALKEDDR